MTVSLYQQMKLVKLEPDGESYFAIPLEKKGTDLADARQIMAVDTDKNLSFSMEYAIEELVSIRDILSFNRFITIRLPFVPGLIEGSAFHLLQLVLRHISIDAEWNDANPEKHLTLLSSSDEWHALEPQSKFKLLVLHSIHYDLCRGLYQTLTTNPEREETLYVEHDFITHRLQSMLIQSGLKYEDM